MRISQLGPTRSPAQAAVPSTLVGTAVYVAILALLAFPHAAQAQSCSPSLNPVACENTLPGNTGWNITGAGDPTIQGFATDISVNVGGTVTFKVSTTASNYHLDIYRMGYYGGAGARKITTVTPSVSLPQTQPACLTDSSTNLMDCGNWAPSASWAVPSTATSGIYFAVLVRADTGGASHIFFIVRNDASHSAMLYQASDETWQAYNPYGGHSLYGDTGFNLPARAYKVSYNRPFNTANLETYTWLFNAEYPMIRWLEANGYDVSYFTGVDAARNGSLILNHKVYLSVGHDEYWSAPHRANVEAARDAGVNMAFFSGNEVFWKTRWENSIDGTNTPYRTLVCYKETLDSTPSGGIKDPADPPTWTGSWRDPRFSPPADGGRPENALTGTIFMVNGPGTDNTDLSIVVPAADGQMRFWRDTSIANLAPGTSATLPAGTLGYEWDSDLDNGSRPPGQFRLSTATYTLTTDLLLDYGGTYGAGIATHNMTLHRAPSGALVFGAGTVQWSWGLDSNHDNGNTPPDIRMQQATVNLFADMGVQPQTLQSGLLPVIQSTDTTPPVSTITSPTSGSTEPFAVVVTVTGTAQDFGSGVVGGVEVSVDGGLTWHPATGRANWTYSWETALGTGHIMSRAVDDSGNIETPSAGINVTVPKPVVSIALDVTASADASVPSTTAQTAAFSTTGSNELLLAYISADSNAGANTVTAVSGGGLTWVLVQRENNQGGDAEIWRAFAPSPLTNITVTATLAQSVRSSITVQAYAGVNTSGTNGSGAIGAVAVGSGTGAPSAQLVTTKNASLVVGVGTDPDNGVARVPASGQTVVHQFLSPSSDTYWVQTQNAPTLVNGTAVAINDVSPTTDRYQMVVCEILPVVLPTWSISGTVSPPSSGTGTTLTLSGAASNTASADASGNYSFTGLVSGAYVVTPSKAGFTFTPASQAVTVNAASVGSVNFTAVPIPTYSLSGTISPAASGSGTNVSLTASGEGNGTFSPVTADASGNYTFTGLPNNTYTVTPSKAGFVFSPATRTLAINGANATGINFTASQPLTAISALAATPSITSATITWTTNVPATSVVNYGTSSGSLTLNVSNSTLVTSHSLTLTGLTAGTVYYYTVTSVDASNIAVTSPPSFPPATFTTLLVPPPVISGLAAIPGPTGTATVTWTTDIASTSVVNYGITSTSLSLNVSNAAMVTSHSITLTGLTTGTTYYFTATSVGASANSATSPPLTGPPASFVENPPFSIWSASAVPGTLDNADTGSIEVGVKFRSDVAGYVTGVRFYKGTTNTGTHVGNLWSSTGALLATVTFSEETASGWQQANFSTPVAINPSTTYVVSYLAPGGHYASDSGFFAASGVDNPPLHALANGIDGSNGVYIYGSTSAFPSQSFNSANYWVDLVFSTPAVIVIPPVISAVTAAPSTTSATITWTTNVPTTSLVNYGTSSGALTLNVSNSTLVTSHSLTLTGLNTGTAYYYTVTSVDALNNTVTSPASPNPPATFTTSVPAPPVLSNLVAIPGPGGTATVTWTTNTATTSVVNYGTTSSSLSLNVTNTALVTAHSITLTGLTAGTTYYYRATSVDASGDTATSPALTGSPASFVENPPYSIWSASALPGTPDNADTGSIEVGVKFRSDVAGYVTGVRFYKGTTNTGTHVGNLWSSTGALLATVTFSGETASGWQQANFSTPVAINPSTTYVVSYFAPGGHYASDAGFFGSSGVDNPPLHALANGVDGSNGVYSYSSTSIFPNQSYNSANYWVDLVFSTPAVIVTLPVISSVSAAPSTASATITWTTNVPTTSLVNYGTSSGSLTLNMSNSSLVTSHSLTLTGLTAGTVYYYTVTSVDALNNSVTSPASPNPPASFTTSVPPVLSGLTAIPGPNGAATVIWTTNTATTSVVNYGTTSSSLNLNASNAALVTSHSITLTGLTVGTTYYFRATSVDSSGNSTTSPALTGSAASFVENPPYSIWSASAVPGTPDAADTDSVEVGLKFRSDVAGYVTGVRFYKGTTNTGTHVGNLWSSTGALLATVTFSGETASGWQQANFSTPVAINPSTTYIVSYFAPAGHYASDSGFFASSGVDNPPLHALANGVDGSNGVYNYSGTSIFPNQSFGSANYWVDLVFSTPAALPNLPVISALTATPATTSATIAWTTNVPTTSLVNYGTSAGSLTLNASSSSLVTTHGLTLTGLATGTTYYYTVTSVDASNNTVTSPASPNPPASFTTQGSAPPVLSGLAAVPGPNGVATVTWTTSTATTSVVNYGTTSSSLSLNVSNATLVTSHSMTLTGLTVGTTYYFRATSVDSSGNSVTSPVSTGPPASFVEEVTTSTSIWTMAATPATVDAGDPNSVEVGTKFQSDVPGYVTGVRFYKSAANTGVHIGNLWSRTGTLLATVTFSGETSSGWQQAAFSNPVLINPNTTYIVSYFAPAGHYSDSSGYFNGSTGDSPPLHALADGVDGGNGIYQYSAASVFPSQTYNSGNYWIDVVFATTTVTVFPSSTVIETGTLAAGTAANLNANDSVYYQVNSTTAATRASAWYGSFPAVPTTLQNLMVTYKGMDSSSCTEVVSIWNWVSSSWVQLDSRAVSTTEVLRGPFVPPGSFGNYVNATSGTGELRVEVKCGTTTGSFTSSGDLMSIEYNN